MRKTYRYLTERGYPRTANKDGYSYTENRYEFKGSNTFAENNEGTYAVYSYGYHFPLYVFKDGSWYENNDKYSVSTSKHKTQLRPRFRGQKVDFKLKNTTELIDIIEG